MNNIPLAQNAPEHLKLLRARNYNYRQAKYLMVLQLILTIGLPIIGSYVAYVNPKYKPFAPAAALIVVFLDALIIDRIMKQIIKKAAKIGEQFDCSVLNISWNSVSVGDRIDCEEINSASRSYGVCNNGLENWYPPEVGNLPLHLARIVCQRTNLRYDSQLRKRYGLIILILFVLLSICFFIVGIAQDMKVADLVLMVATAAPFLSWAPREFYRQRDTADSLDSLLKESTKLWEICRTAACTVDECSTRSRQLQDAIYSRRATSPLILPLLYWFHRANLEDDATEAAKNFVSEFQNAQSPSRITKDSTDSSFNLRGQCGSS